MNRVGFISSDTRSALCTTKPPPCSVVRPSRIQTTAAAAGDHGKTARSVLGYHKNHQHRGNDVVADGLAFYELETISRQKNNHKNYTRAWCNVSEHAATASKDFRRLVSRSVGQPVGSTTLSFPSIAGRPSAYHSGRRRHDRHRFLRRSVERRANVSRPRAFR